MAAEQCFSLDLSQKLIEALNADDLIKSERLLKKGADPNTVLAVEGVAPMHIASGTGVEASQLLLQYGGDPNIRSVEGATPLHIAATWGDQACLQMLLQNGGDPYLRDQDESSAIDCAKEYDHHECVQLLEHYALLLNPEEGCTITPKYFYHKNGCFNNSSQDKSLQQNQTKKRKSCLYNDLYLDEFLDWASKKKDSSLYDHEINRKLDKILSSETPVYLDVTSPDHPFLDFKNQKEPDKFSSLHVHWEDQLPIKDQKQKRESVCSSISTDTFITCPSEPDQETLTLKESHNEQPKYEQLDSTLTRSNYKNLMNINMRNGNMNTDYNYDTVIDEDSPCNDCQKLQNEKNWSMKEGYRSDVHSPFCSATMSKIGSRKKKIRCDRNLCGKLAVRKSLDDLMAQETCKCNRNDNELEQKWHQMEEPLTKIWKPPLAPLLEETEIISSDGSFLGDKTEEKNKSTNTHQQPINDSSQKLDLRILDNFSPSTQNLAKERVLKWKEEHFPNYASLTPKSKAVAKSSILQWGKGYFPSDFYNPVITSDSDTSTLDGRRDNGDTRVDLDKTLPFEFEQISLEPKSERQSLASSVPRQSVGSDSSDVFNRSFYKSRISMDSLYSNASTVEYVYTDPEKGITLIEKHIPSNCGSSGRPSLDSIYSATTVDSQKTDVYDWQHYSKPAGILLADTERTEIYDWQQYTDDLSDDKSHDSQTTELYDWLNNEDCKTESQSNIVPESLKSLQNGEIREKLQSFGDDPGPVTDTTRQTYLVRLWKAQSDPNSVQLGIQKEIPDYLPELRSALDGKFDCRKLYEVESCMVEAFQNPTKNRRWREGTIKSSFNYLLLDPRVTQNLPNRACSLGEIEVFRTFIAAIFYIGKGKRARPYSHLYEAISHMQCPKDKVSDKVQHILDIWKDGLGVVSLHCFQSVIPVEAYTREACMVDAIGLHKLTNKKRGDYYGLATTWPIKKKREVGVHLLKKVLQIFLGEGERQISPPDIKMGQ